MSMNWQCPYCSKHSVLTTDSYDTAKGFVSTSDKGKDGDLTYGLGYFVCPNPECKEYVLNIRIHRRVHDQSVKHYAKYDDGAEVLSYRLRPRGNAKPIPDYIPNQLRTDYSEACLILQDSPKASATLSRRCLQGLIRDYYKITKATLNQEIRALQDQLPTDLWEAVDAIREVGNVGAHCEKDVNVMIDVSYEAASALIGLIELLFEETYVRDHNRKKRIEAAKGASKSVNGEPKGKETTTEDSST